MDTTFIIDNGSYNLRFGTTHMHTVDSVVKTLRKKQHYMGLSPPTYVGNIQNEHLYTRTRLLKNGIADSMESLSKLYEYALDSAAPEWNYIVTYKSPTTKHYRHQIASLMFDVFDVNGLYFGEQSELSLLSTGKTSGVVLDCGYNMTTCTPIQEGCALYHARIEYNYSATDVLAKIQESYPEQLRAYSSRAVEVICTDILETHCFTGQPEYSSIYTLPDGKDLVLGDELCNYIEPYFQPRLIDQYHQPGVHRMITDCLEGESESLWNDIVLCGGMSTITGFAQRIQEHVHEKSPIDSTIVHELDGSAPFHGARLLSAKDDFSKYCITRAEYEEHGKRIVFQK